MRPDCPAPSFLLRQPLLDANYRIAGYQLSLRDRAPVPVLPGAASLDQARDENLLVHVADLDRQKVLNGRIAVVELSGAIEGNPLLSQMPPGKIVVPLSAGLPDLDRRSGGLNALGFQPMLEDDATHAPALPVGCTSVRLDLSAGDAITLGKRADQYRRLGATRLVARAVDSEESFEAGARLGFGLFQGDFLSRPALIPGRKLDSGVMRVMELLNLTMAKTPFNELEQGFKRDAALSYRLLRYINSPANGLNRAMESIGQALMWLGHDPLYRWLSLLLFSGTSNAGRGDALLRTALVRARFMENLGLQRVEPRQRGGLFIVGVLSLLDALLGQPMAEAIAPLRLPEAMSDALVGGTGLYAPYLALCRACEGFDLESVVRVAKENGLSADEVNIAHVNALIWAESLDK